MRLGNYPCVLKEGTKAALAYGRQNITERHRHRFEFNNRYRDLLEQKGLIIAGTSADGFLVEICELKNHAFMVACQFHPEFLSRPSRAHPLFLSFMAAAQEVIVHGRQSRLPLTEK
jgi:CTP synthase